MSTNTAVEKGVTEMQAIAVTNLAEGRLGDSADPEVRAAANVAAQSANSLLAIADTAKGKLSEIAHREERGELPKAGADTLRSEVRDEVESLAREAQRTFEQAHSDAQELAVISALPEVAQDREILARQEMSLALGDSEGPEAVSRVFGLANGGSDEAVAVLVNTSFGRQSLISRGVRDVDETLTQARQIVASKNEATGATLASLEKLGTAFQAGTKVVDFSLGL
jgi:hypothetical protein